MNVLEFLTELQNAEIYPVTLIRSDSNTDAFPVISKVVGTLIGNVYSGVSFQSQYVLGSQAPQKQFPCLFLAKAPPKSANSPSLPF